MKSQSFPPNSEQLLTLFKPHSNYQKTGISRQNKLLRESTTATRLKLFAPPGCLTWVTFFILFTSAIIVFGFLVYECLYAAVLYKEDHSDASVLDYIRQVWNEISDFVSSPHCVTFSVLFSFSLLSWSIAL